MAGTAASLSCACVCVALMRGEPANALEARLRGPQRFLGMKSPTVPAYSGSFGLGMSEGPIPVAAFWITMKPKPNMARRACLISRSRIMSHSSLLYFAVKVGPNHLGLVPEAGAVGFQPRSPGWTPVSY